MRPVVQTKKSAGADIYASEDMFIPAYTNRVVSTDYMYDLPCAADIRSRSGLAFKNNVHAFNGLIDEDYNGKEVKVLLMNLSEDNFLVKAGERIAQLVPHEGRASDYFFTKEKTRTGGFGSSNECEGCCECEEESIDQDIELSEAAAKGYLKSVKYLVESGVDVNKNNNEALRRAIENEQTEVVEYLESLNK